MGRLFGKKTRQRLWRNWGYIALPVIVWAWIAGFLGAAPLAIASTIVFGYFLFQAKTPCGAPIRERDPETGEHLLCRNNAKGLLGGCGQYQAHKWGNAKLMASRSTWGRLFRSLVRDKSGRATAIGSLANVGVMLGTFGTMLVTLAK